MDLGLKGRVAIVAAASKGLGRAIATELATEGCEVAICARTSADVECTAQEIGSAAGREIFWRALDVTNADGVRDFVAAVEKKFGRIDICVTNTGGPPSKKFMEISLDEWRTAVNLVLLSSVYFAREVLPRMQRRRCGRLPKPEELAALVAFLASERASSINGTTIAVDGGSTKGLL